MTNNDIKQIGESLMTLAEHLTDIDCEITANEILDELSGRLICEEEASEVRTYLST